MTKQNKPSFDDITNKLNISIMPYGLYIIV